jgi:hypothetical protein
MTEPVDPAECTNCGKPKEQLWNWFCNRCTAAKERAYQQCREAGTNNFLDVVNARDKALAEARTLDPLPPELQLPETP